VLDGIDDGYDRARSVEHGSGHDGSVLGEGVWQHIGIFDVAEEAAICGHLGFFPQGQFEHEIPRKSITVAPDLYRELSSGPRRRLG
jgi:hypothetical protein